MEKKEYLAEIGIYIDGSISSVEEVEICAGSEEEAKRIAEAEADKIERKIWKEAEALEAKGAEFLKPWDVTALVENLY